MYHSTCAIKGQLAEICSLFSSHGFRGSNSGHQACRQVPSATGPSLSAHPVRFLCLSLLSTVTVERREVRSPGSAARVGRKSFGGLSGKCQCSPLLWKQSWSADMPLSDPKYLQESNLVLDEGVQGHVHLDLLGQSGPVLAHKDTLVQTALIQHSWEKKKEGGPRNPPELGLDGKSLRNPPSYPAYLECTWRCGGAGNG